MGNQMSGGNKQSIISSEDEAKAEAIFKEKGPVGLAEYLKTLKSAWESTPVDLGIIGGSGAGKSTFINTILGLKAGDIGSAAVGITETSMQPTPYPHPQNPLLKLWDLPGVGTPNFPKDAYLEAIGFEKYDCFIVITATRFTELDTWLATEILKTSRRVYFVRTRFQEDVDNDKEDNAKHDERGLLRMVRGNMREQVKNAAPVFVIDSKRPNKYDFNQLVETAILEIPCMLKREAAILTLNSLTTKMIASKTGVLNNRTWTSAFTFQLDGALIIPNFDSMLEEVKFYYETMGLDECSLKHMAEASLKDYKQLRDSVDSHFPEKWLSSIETLKKALQSANINGLAAKAANQWSSSLPPFLFLAISSVTSYWFQFAALKWSLKKIEEAAAAVAKILLSDEE